MKRIFSSKKLIAMLFLLLLIIACGGKKDTNNEETTSNNQAKSQDNTESQNKQSEALGPGPNEPQFKIITPQEGSNVGKAEFVLELKNTEYPKFRAFYGEQNSTEIGDVFTLDLENGEQTVTIELLDKQNNILDTKKVLFTLTKTTEEIKEQPSEEPKAKDLLKKEETKTETPKVETPPASIETADTSEAKSLGLDFEIKFPTPGFSVKGNIVAIRLIPSASFTFGEINTTHVPGKGYFKYKLNNGDWTDEESATFTVKNLEKGTNTVYIEMMRNDMTSYGIQKHVSFEGQTVTGKN